MLAELKKVFLLWIIYHLPIVQIETHFHKAQDLEKKREKALLKDFETYRAFTGRRLKEFRLEVLRAGFKTAWANKDFATIISVAQKIPEDALQEDEKLLLWYDQALTYAGQ